MKTWKIFGLMALLLAGFSACSDDSTKKPGDDESGGEVEIPVITEKDTVRLWAQILFGDTDVPWRETDSISVLVDTANWLFKTETGGTKALFCGQADAAEAYYALYPYQENAAMETLDGKVKVYAELPTEQKAIAGGYDYHLNMAVGIPANDTTLDFKLLCGMLKFNLQDCASDIASIRLYGHNNEGLAGKLTIDAKTLAIETAEAQEMILTPAEGEVFDKNPDYYIFVAPGNFKNGVSIDFTDNKGKTASTYSGEPIRVIAGNVVNLNKEIEDFIPQDMAWGVTYAENDAHRFWEVLQHVSPEYGKILGNITISEADLEKFKRISDEWCAGLSTDKEKAEEICRQVAGHLTYGAEVAQDSPVLVWEAGVGNCYGYSNTYKTFCYVQGIPCIGGNGKVYSTAFTYGAGHSWTFAYFDGQWWLMDALWSKNIEASSVDNYGTNWDETGQNSWQTLTTDVVLAEDNTFKYGYYHGLSVYGIQAGAGSEVVIPATCSVLGDVDVTSFMPEEPLPSNVKRITIGANISNLGEEVTNLASGCAALRDFAPNVEWFEVAEGNRTYTAYKGIIYRGGYDAPLHIPGAMREVELRPADIVDKDFVMGSGSVETIRFAEGTGEIRPGAVSLCPNLKTVYVPEDTEIASGAFESDVKIVRY